MEPIYVNAYLVMNCENRAARKSSYGSLYQCDFPSGSVRKHFIRLLIEKFNRVLIRKWIIEKSLYFAASMFQVVPDTKKIPNIRCRFKQHLLEWEQEQFQMLDSNAILCVEANVRRKSEQFGTK